eukprot:CAMPEP_0117436282 /NCGR_PEP_ID=MMETSP0759-20121206/925_1 /TAXON_ID=63605 /ORGANISM="Percolomonas cosmopolitus, Strain WS" /LENGTH=747 /DNA_ID=CAMNT_0005227873 /DNA_START=454 /DNA_END=2697 /DNA_ORIENTATION=+
MYCMSGARSAKHLEHSDQHQGPHALSAAAGAECLRDGHQLHFRKTYPWKKMTFPSDFPQERFSHVMWSRTKTKSLWMAAGLSEDLSVLTDMWCIDNSTQGHWKIVMEQIPINVYACSALYHKHSDSVIFYGVNGLYKLEFPSPDLNLFDRDNGVADKFISWSRSPPPSEYANRMGHAAQWMQKNHMIVFGGESWEGEAPHTDETICLDAISETTGWFEQAIRNKNKRSSTKVHHSLTNRVVLNDLLIFDIVRCQWYRVHGSTHKSLSSSKRVPFLPAPRAHHSSCVVKRTLYIYGGLQLKNGKAVPVTDMDVVWALDLHKLSKQRDEISQSSIENLAGFNLWRRVSIQTDHYIPRSVVGFSLDLIARKDKVVAFIGFGGYDLEQRKAVNRMFTLIDSQYAHLDPYNPQATPAVSNISTKETLNSSAHPSESVKRTSSSPSRYIEDVPSPRRDHVVQKPFVPTLNIQRVEQQSTLSHQPEQLPAPSLRKLTPRQKHAEPQVSPNSPRYAVQDNGNHYMHKSPREHNNTNDNGGSLFNSDPISQPMRSDPLVLENSNSMWSSSYNDISNYSLFSAEPHVIYQKSSRSILDSSDDENESLDSKSRKIKALKHQIGLLNAKESTLESEVQNLRSNLIRQQQLHIQETQFREIDYQSEVRKATNLRFRLTSAECKGMPLDRIQNIKKDLEASLSVVNQALDQSALCIKCQRALRSVVLFPCTHLKLCEECSDECSHCPVCSTQISEKFRVTL